MPSHFMYKVAIDGSIHLQTFQRLLNGELYSRIYSTQLTLKTILFLHECTGSHITNQTSINMESNQYKGTLMF